MSVAFRLLPDDGAEWFCTWYHYDTGATCANHATMGIASLEEWDALILANPTLSFMRALCPDHIEVVKGLSY